MENRRGKRGGGGTAEITESVKSSPKPVRASPVSKSPSRRSSPARTRSPSRKSPVRTRSPARATRSPGRPRSPARTRSPARQTKSAATQRRSGRNKNEIKITDNDTASETDDSKSDIASKRKDRKSAPKSTVTKNSTTTTTTASSIKVSNITNEGDDEVARLTAKYLQHANEKLNAVSNIGITPSEQSTKRSYSRSVSRSVLDDEEWSHSEHSDGNENNLFANRITRSRSKTHGNYLLRREAALNDGAAEFGGSIGASLLIILVSVLCIGIQYVCSRQDCSFRSLRLKDLKSLSTYITLDAGYLYIGSAWFIYIFSIIPYTGHKKQLSAKINAEEATCHYFNGLATTAVILGGLGVTEGYFKYPICALIYKHYQPLCVISVLYALVLSGWCFCRSAYFPVRNWNPYAKSGRLFSDLFIGREINPRWFQIIDIKLTHLRLSLITTLVLNVVFLTRNIKFAPLPAVAAGQTPLTFTENALHLLQNVKLDPVAATISSLIILYVLDALIFEHHLTSSFELQHEGVGAQLLLRYALFPVWTSLIAKFALQHKITGVPNWALATIAAIYLSGLILKRLSNELKYNFRVYPLNARSTSKCIIIYSIRASK